MASPLTLYFVDSAVPDGTGFGTLQIGGTAPSVSTMGTGWTFGTAHTSNEYAILSYGSVQPATAFGTGVLPSGSPPIGVGAAFRTPGTISGSFSAAVWTVAMGVLMTVGGTSGNAQINYQVWSSPDPSGTTAISRISNSMGQFAIATLTQQNASGVSVPGYFTLSNSYLFVQLVCDVLSGDVSVTGSTVKLVQDGTNSVVTTPAFTPVPGTLTTQRRAPGFPPKAPLPGIPRIGVGLLEGQPSVYLTSSQALGGLRQSSTLTETIALVVAQGLGGLQQSSTLTETIALSVAQRLGGLQQSSTLTETIALSAAQKLGGLGETASDYTTIATVPLRTQRRAPGFPPNAPLPGIPRIGVGLLEGQPSVYLTSSQALGGLRQSSTLTETVSLSVAQKLGGLRQSSTLTEAPRFSATQALAGLQQSATLTETIALSAAQKLGGLQQSATMAGPATSAATLLTQRRIPGFPLKAPLPGIPRIGAGSLKATPLVDQIIAAQKLGGLRQSSTLTETVSLSVAQQLGGLRQSSTLTETVSLSVAQKLGGLRQSSTLTETISLTTAQKLGGLRQSSTLAGTFALAVSQHLGGLRQSTSLSEAISVAVVQHLHGLRQSASVNVDNGLPPNLLTVVQCLGGLGQVNILRNRKPPPTVQYLTNIDYGTGTIFYGLPRRFRKRVFR